MNSRQLLIPCLLLAWPLAACPKPAETSKPKGETPSTGTTAPAASADGPRVQPQEVVATWTGGQLTYADLQDKGEAHFTKLRTQYLQNLYTQEKQVLEGIIVETLVKKAAAAKGVTEENYFDSIVGTPEISDAEVAAFYEQVAKQSGQPLEAIAPRIKEFLVNKKKQEAFIAEVDRLKKEAGVSITLPAPEVPRVKFDLAGRPMKGKETAKVTVVEFSDFECPYCSRAVPGVEELLKAYPEDVKVYFLHYPLSFHKSAMPSAVASMCAHKQGKFWEMHDGLFAQQQNLSQDRFMAIAKEQGMDVAAFETCLKDPGIAQLIQADQAQGEAAGVEGTPSFYINGVKHEGGVPTVDEIKEAMAGS